MKHSGFILWCVIGLVLFNMTPEIFGASCDCSKVFNTHERINSPIENWGDDLPNWTEEEERLYRAGLSEPPVKLFQKAGDLNSAIFQSDAPESYRSKDRLSDVIRIYVERADEYADRDPWGNDSDPYIRFYIRGTAGGWIYLGSSDIVEGCDGDDCDAVFEYTMDADIDRADLWDVSPEVWDDDGGWSDDELLAVKDFNDVPASGMALSWQYMDDDGDYQCWERFSVEYIDNGADVATWNSYPSGTVSSGTFDWNNPADRSGIDFAELHLSSDATFDASDEYIYTVSGSIYTFDCLNPPDNGTYYFAVVVQDNAGMRSDFASPGTTFTVECATPTPTATPLPPVIPSTGGLGILILIISLGALTSFTAKRK